MLQQFLEQYGYLALLIGTFFEGETVLVLAGFLAHRGYLQLDYVIATAFIGSYAGDQLWYFLGRRHGRAMLARRPHWQATGDRALRLLHKHPDLWVLGFRFVYGLRSVMPIAIGLSGYPPLRFMLLNAVSALIWAAALAQAAFHLGTVLQTLLDDLARYELWILAALALLGGGLWLRRRLKRQG